jgi:hypothetical protein
MIRSRSWNIQPAALTSSNVLLQRGRGFLQGCPTLPKIDARCLQLVRKSSRRHSRGLAEPSFPVINPLIMAMPSGEAVRLAAKASTPASFTFFSLLLF